MRSINCGSRVTRLLISNGPSNGVVSDISSVVGNPESKNNQQSHNLNPRKPILFLNVSVILSVTPPTSFQLDPSMMSSIHFWEGALLVMMGQQTRSESLFYYFRMEDHIPEDHLPRLVDRQIDFTFILETLKASYSHTGRPSIDPEVLLRILLIGYLYGITSERRLVEDVGMHLAYRGSLGSASIKRFRITPRFPRIGTAVFRSRRFSSNSSNESSSSV